MDIDELEDRIVKVCIQYMEDHHPFQLKTSGDKIGTASAFMAGMTFGSHLLCEMVSEISLSRHQPVNGEIFDEASEIIRRSMKTVCEAQACVMSEYLNIRTRN